MQISVVIPCHNAGRWIGETLRSVAAQTLAPHEVIVVDDASTDDSREVYERFAKYDARFRGLFQERNSGNVFVQWNRGVRDR